VGPREDQICAVLTRIEAIYTTWTCDLHVTMELKGDYDFILFYVFWHSCLFRDHIFITSVYKFIYFQNRICFRVIVPFLLFDSCQVQDTEGFYPMEEAVATIYDREIEKGGCEKRSHFLHEVTTKQLVTFAPDLGETERKGSHLKTLGTITRSKSFHQFCPCSVTIVFCSKSMNYIIIHELICSISVISLTTLSSVN